MHEFESRMDVILTNNIYKSYKTIDIYAHVSKKYVCDEYAIYIMFMNNCKIYIFVCEVLYYRLSFMHHPT